MVEVAVSTPQTEHLDLTAAMEETAVAVAVAVLLVRPISAIQFKVVSMVVRARYFLTVPVLVVVATPWRGARQLQQGREAQAAQV